MAAAAKEVYEMNSVHVTPGRLDDCLKGLRQAWLSPCELQKKYGTANDCAIYASTTIVTARVKQGILRDGEQGRRLDQNQRGIPRSA